jgi:hypothetical protein
MSDYWMPNDRDIEDTREPDEREENPYEDDDFEFDWDRDTELERR